MQMNRLDLKLFISSLLQFSKTSKYFYECTHIVGYSNDTLQHIIRFLNVVSYIQFSDCRFSDKYLKISKTASFQNIDS